MIETYKGACHCGAFQFEISAEILEMTTCDCSLCRKKNALMTKVHESELSILQGQEALTEYRWNMNIARHFFCASCGIYTFHRKRAQLDHYGVNVRCLENFDTTRFPVRATEGLAMSVLDRPENRDWPGPRVTAG